MTNFSDDDLLKNNVARLESDGEKYRISVSKEHYLWLALQLALLKNDKIVLMDGHARLNRRIHELRSDLQRLWHFAGCPFDHCQKCINDAEWIKSLEERFGPPSSASVIAQHEAR